MLGSLFIIISLFTTSAFVMARVAETALIPFEQSNQNTSMNMTILRMDERCEAFMFRLLSGRCTSAADSSLGEAHRALNSYFDTNSLHPSTKNFSSARQISNIVCNQQVDTRNSMNLNELFTFFGQFIDHDFSFSPSSSPPEHFDIPIPSDDPILKAYHLDFTRSERVAVGGAAGVERPVNVLSSAFDLSTVYGVDKARNDFLRMSDSCRMKTSSTDMLPFNTEGLPNQPNTSPTFFIAGDIRANENPMLIAMHTVWLRAHNHICDLLEDSFPNFSAEKQYETARAINIALYQKTIYEEWLPAIFGSKLSTYQGYQPNIDPTINVEFSTAGFRLGHTLVGNDVSRIDDLGNVLPSIPTQAMFFTPSSLKNSNDLEDILRGALGTSAQEVDELVMDSLRNFLFEMVPEEEGFDLVALNLQRGRDHNLASFNDLRELFLGQRASSMAEISSRKQKQEKLERAYASVDDVEAWIGLVTEDKDDGVGLGRTLAAMWRREFTSMRDGDQFFYLNRLDVDAEVFEKLPEVERDIFGGAVVFSSILERTTRIRSSLLRRGQNAFIL